MENKQLFINKHKAVFNYLVLIESDTNVLFKELFSFEKKEIENRVFQRLCNLYKPEAKKYLLINEHD